MLEDVIEVLTEQMIKNRFEDKEEKYIVAKEQLYKFCIKLVKKVKEVYVKRDKEQNKKINELKKEIARLKGIIRYRKF